MRPQRYHQMPLPLESTSRSTEPAELGGGPFERFWNVDRRAKVYTLPGEGFLFLPALVGELNPLPNYEICRHDDDDF